MYKLEVSVDEISWYRVQENKMYREGCVLIWKLVKRIHLQTRSYGWKNRVGGLRSRFPYNVVSFWSLSLLFLGLWVL